MAVKCGICRQNLQKTTEEAEFTCYPCSHCGIHYYVYAPISPSQPIKTNQSPEKPSIFALLFPFMVVAGLELLYHLSMG